ncbi:MAG: tetratricopeptide repeat protein [Symploca sp. SIO2E9]|nr:tetratricopeptide repeat protein [Symploca sp. SIO2E9]
MTQQTRNKAQQYAKDGEVYRLKGEYHLARVKFKQAIGLQPNYAWAHAHLGEALFQESLEQKIVDMYFSQVKDAFEKAIEIDNSYAWAYAHFGRFYTENIKYDKAEENLTKATEINDSYAWAWAHLGSNYYRKENPEYDQALCCLDKAIGILDNYAWAIHQKGTVFYLTDQYEKALHQFLSVIAIDPSIFRSANRECGLIYRIDGNLELALIYFDKALKENQNDIESEYHKIGTKLKLRESNPNLAKSEKFSLGQLNLEIEGLQKKLTPENKIYLQELTKDYIVKGLDALNLKNNNAQTGKNVQTGEGEIEALINGNPTLRAIAKHDPAWQ